MPKNELTFRQKMDGIRELFISDKIVPVLDKAKAPGVDLGRYTEALIRACGKNLKVMNASPGSLIQCLMDSVSMGLLIGGQLGYGYVVPYGGEAQFQIGYNGLLHLAYNDGRSVAASAEVVHDGDLFEYRLGTKRYVKHEPSLESKAGRPIIAAYAVVDAAPGCPFVQVDGIENLDEHAQQYVKKARDTGEFPNDALYVTNPVRWYQKTMLRRALKFAPLSETALRVLGTEEYIEAGAPLDSMRSGDEQPTDNLRALMAGAAPLEGET